MSHEGETTTPDVGAEEIHFQFRFAEPLVGRVVATRTLERQGLDTLESKIEWAIRIEPSGDTLHVSSRDLKISPLRASLPEDALNQLLIGRMFLPSGVLNNDGVFRTGHDTKESVEALHSALFTASVSPLPDRDVVSFVNSALSEDSLETACREHWKTMVQSFIGKTMQLGETYETEAPTDMPLGGSVVFVSKVKVVSEEPDVSSRSGSCLRIESHSQPKGSLIDAIQKSAANHMPPGASVERFDVTLDMVQMVEPSTLVPHSLTIVKTTNLDMRLPNGMAVPTREVSTENWQYVWEIRESREMD